MRVGTAFQIGQRRKQLWNWKAWEKPEKDVTETTWIQRWKEAKDSAGLGGTD